MRGETGTMNRTKGRLLGGLAALGISGVLLSGTQASSAPCDDRPNDECADTNPQADSLLSEVGPNDAPAPAQGHSLSSDTGAPND
jgi:hypothetical protein